MTPDFEYFFWAAPEKDKPFFALYDLFDNHFMMLSDNYEMLFKVKRLIKTKAVYNIVDLTNIDIITKASVIDNSRADQWGLKSAPEDLYGDINFRWLQNTNAAEHYQTLVIKNPTLKPFFKSPLDDFKIDLQRQLFFIYYCVNTINSGTESIVLSHLQRAVDLGVNYDDTVERFLDLSSIVDKQQMENMLMFLRHSRLFYE
jgi:hypothetical protein